MSVKRQTFGEQAWASVPKYILKCETTWKCSKCSAQTTTLMYPAVTMMGWMYSYPEGWNHSVLNKLFCGPCWEEIKKVLE